MAWAGMPLDVILEITPFLDLHDSIHPLVTCSSFESLLSLKDFWLKTLDRIQTVHMQPLPWPPGVNLFDMPIEALRKFAIHAYSLKKNGSSERAIPVSVRSIDLGDDYHQIPVVPGADIVVTNSHVRLACWRPQSGALER
ncbi:hypothetical protein B0H13DRAFT_2315738 [Mycena leptocephala]|nr:hypothetical protein B0H13DRAFT_2315738 [Mycena leptocephala]